MPPLPPVNIDGRSFAAIALATNLQRRGIPNLIRSSVPDLRIHGPAPLVLEPQMLTLLERITGINQLSIRERLAESAFAKENAHQLAPSGQSLGIQSDVLTTDTTHLTTLFSPTIQRIIDQGVRRLSLRSHRVTLHLGDPVEHLESSFTVIGANQKSSFLRNRTANATSVLPLICVAGTAEFTADEYKRLASTAQTSSSAWMSSIQYGKHKILVQAWKVQHEDPPEGEPNLSADIANDVVSVKWLYSRPRYQNDMIISDNYSGPAPEYASEAISADLEHIAQHADGPIKEIIQTKTAGSRPHLAALSTFLISKAQLDELTKHHLALIGPTAHKLPWLGMMVGSSEISGYFADALTLADCISTCGTTQAAIEVFYHERYADWQATHDKMYETIMRLHGLSAYKTALPLERPSLATTVVRKILPAPDPFTSTSREDALEKYNTFGPMKLSTAASHAIALHNRTKPSPSQANITMDEAEHDPVGSQPRQDVRFEPFLPAAMGLRRGDEVWSGTTAPFTDRSQASADQSVSHKSQIPDEEGIWSGFSDWLSGTTDEVLHSKGHSRLPTRFMPEGTNFRVFVPGSTSNARLQEVHQTPTPARRPLRTRRVHGDIATDTERTRLVGLEKHARRVRFAEHQSRYEPEGEEEQGPELNKHER